MYKGIFQDYFTPRGASTFICYNKDSLDYAELATAKRKVKFIGYCSSLKCCSYKKTVFPDDPIRKKVITLYKKRVIKSENKEDEKCYDCGSHLFWESL